MISLRDPARQRYARAAARTAASDIADQVGADALPGLLASVSDIALCSIDLLTNPNAIGEAFVVFAGAGSDEGCGGARVILLDVIDAYEATRHMPDRDARSLALLAHLGRVAASAADAAPLPEEHAASLAALAGLVLTEAEFSRLLDTTYLQPIIAIVGDGTADRPCGKIHHAMTSVPEAGGACRAGTPASTGAARH